MVVNKLKIQQLVSNVRHNQDKIAEIVENVK